MDKISLSGHMSASKGINYLKLKFSDKVYHQDVLKVFKKKNNPQTTTKPSVL